VRPKHAQSLSENVKKNVHWLIITGEQPEPRLHQIAHGQGLADFFADFHQKFVPDCLRVGYALAG